MIRYVAGFALAPRSVLLVRKTHPAQLAGRWNAVGGKVDAGELPAVAMEREFAEETGFKEQIFWAYFCTLRGRYPLDDKTATDFVVEFYYAKFKAEFNAYVRNDVGEDLAWMSYKFAADPTCVLPNVTWLLPMARSFAYGERASEFIVEERYG